MKIALIILICIYVIFPLGSEVLVNPGSAFVMAKDSILVYSLNLPEKSLAGTYEFTKGESRIVLFPGHNQAVTAFELKGKYFLGIIDSRGDLLSRQELPAYPSDLKPGKDVILVSTKSSMNREELTLYDSRLKKKGSYLFTNIQLIDFEIYNGGAGAVYYDRINDSYWVGIFNSKLEFRFQWEYSNLMAQDMEVGGDHFYVKYKNNENRVFIGSFDENLKFLGEIEFTLYPVNRFKTFEEDVLVHYKNRDNGTAYIDLYSPGMKWGGTYEIGAHSWVGRPYAPGVGRVGLLYKDRSGRYYEGFFDGKMTLLKKNDFGRILLRKEGSKPEITVTTKPLPVQEDKDQPFVYDPDAEYPREGQISIGKLRVLFTGTQALIKGQYMYDLGVYNQQYQFWQYKSKQVNKIDPRDFFTSLKADDFDPNRLVPYHLSFEGGLSAEAKGPYDYSKDKEFKKFLAYLDKKNAPGTVKDYYIHAAANPAKRGDVLPFGAYYKQNRYTDGQVGLQFENLKPLDLKNQKTPQDMTDHGLVVAGGMAASFVQHEGNYVRSADHAYNLFRDNKKVPLTILVIKPPSGKVTPGILSGKALEKRVKQDMESCFKKAFNVSLVNVTWDYSPLYNNSNRIPPALHFEMVTTKLAQENVVENSLILYYFTDREGLGQFDGEFSHPTKRGTYATDWEKVVHTALHEFGHALGLRHHFLQDEAFKKESYFSPGCVMNYLAAYGGNEACHLCTYALGIE